MRQEHKANWQAQREAHRQQRPHHAPAQ
jgi:hypothetical protein